MNRPFRDAQLAGEFVFESKQVILTLQAGGTVDGSLRLEHDACELRVGGGYTLNVNPDATMKVVGGTGAGRARLLLDGTPGSSQWRLNVRPGTTTRSIMEYLGLENTLLGVDVIQNRQVVANDVHEQQLWDLIHGRKAKAVLTIIGVIMYLRFGWLVGHLGLAKVIPIVLIANMIMGGTSGPVTLPELLVQMNAEILAGIVLALTLR